MTLNDFFFILMFLFWVGLLIINPVIAQEKGRSAVGAFFASLFFAPLVYLYLLAVPIQHPKS